MLRVFLKIIAAHWREDWLCCLVYLPPRFAFALSAIVFGYLTSTRKQRAELAAARLATCRPCVMYDKANQTCGHIGQFTLGRPAGMDWQDRLQQPPIQIGCWCRLPLAAKLPRKTCWLRVRGLQGGWEK